VPSSINYPPDAKGKWSLPILLALIALAAASFFSHPRPSKERLLADLTSRLRAEQFGRLYDESSHMLHQNVTKERFVRRMREAVARMRAIDPALNFKRDAWREGILSQPEDERYVKLAAERLEGGGKSASVLIFWDSDGNFSDISVLPQQDTPQEYEVVGVGAFQYHVKGTPLDW